MSERSPIAMLRQAVGSYLVSVFRQTEEANRQAILHQIDPVPGSSLLDCGCGDGSFTVELAASARATDVCGVEISPERVAAAKKRGIEVTEGDLNSAIPFEDDRFDVVHANQVIEHLHGTDRFLTEIRRVLKPGGTAILSTNNLSSWHNVASLTLGVQPPPAHVSSEVIVGNPLDPMTGSAHPTPGDSHLRIFSYKGLRDICRYHGFDVVSYGSVGYYPLPPSLAAWAVRLDPWHGAFLVAKLTKRT